MGHNSILVTRCAGFIGFHVAKSLLAQGYRVMAIDNLVLASHGESRGG